MENSRRPPRPKQQPKEYFRCAQCGPDPAATKHPPTKVSCSTWVKNTEVSSCSQKALGNCAASTVQPASSVALSDHNDATDAASVRAIHHSVNIVWAILFRTDDSSDITECSAQRCARRSAPSSELHSQCPQVTLLTTARCQLQTTRQAGARRASLGLRNGTLAVRGLSPRHGLGRKSRRSHGRTPVSLPWSPVPCCNPERNSELKQRLHLCETGQISDLISKVQGQQNSEPLRRRARRMQPQTDEQRGKRAFALTARGSINKAMKGLVGSAAQGSADCRRNAELGHSNSSHRCKVRRGGANCLERRAIQTGAQRAVREQGRSKTGIASLLHVSAPGPTGERQGNLDAIVSFAGALSQSSGQQEETCWKSAASFSTHN